MPKLPMSEISASSTLVNAPMLSNTAGPDAFGANVGRALEQVGTAIGQGGQVVGKIAKEEIERKRTEDVANKVASTDWLSKELALRNEVDEDATDYHQLAVERYRETVDQTADTIDDDNTRMAYRQQMLSQLPNIAARSAAYEFTVKADRSKENANVALSSLQNKIMADPTMYDAYKKQGMDVIAARPNMTASLKAGMLQQWSMDSAKRRFDGLMNNAKTQQDYDTIEAELKGKGDVDWQSEMMPRDFEDTLNKVGAARRAQQTQQNADTKSALKVLEERDDDPTNLIPQEELMKAGRMAAQSTDPEARVRYGRIARNQDIIKSERKLTPAQLRTQMEKNKENPVGVDSTPPEVATAVNAAAVAYDVNASYIQVTRGKESAGNPNAKNPNSTATGSGQFIDKTWLDLAKDPAVASALGVTPSMTDAEILALRKDDAKSITATAILAKKNRSFMEPILGRAVTDVELYGAHFLGAPEAVRFVKMLEANPDTVAADVFPKAAEVNKPVFYKDGKPLTLGQVYDGFARPFVGAVASAAYDDNQVRKNMLDKMETALAGPDALKFAASVGVVQLTPLDQEGGFSARASAVQTASEYYGRTILPFTSDELAYANKIVEEGNVEANLSLMGDIQSMGPKTAKAAYAQLKVKSPAFAHAGSLELDGEPTVAADIVRGAKRMKENPSLLTGLDFRPEQATADFEATIGPALQRVAPAERQGVQEAAVAYLVETKGAAGKKYNKSDYQAAVKSVLGNRLDLVNGEKTYLPKGITGRDVERTLSHMTVQDYVAMSSTGEAPLHADGSVADPGEIDDEGVFRAIGDDKYIVTDSSGAFLWTGKTTPEGYPEKYIIELKPERIRNILARKIVAQR